MQFPIQVGLLCLPDRHTWTSLLQRATSEVPFELSQRGHPLNLAINPIHCAKVEKVERCLHLGGG